MLLRAQLEESADYNVSSLFTKSGEFRNATSSHEEMTSIRKQVANALRHAIIEGTFLPGQELNDGLLCRHFGVSRTTMREALRYLEAERLIVVKTNRRTYVCCPNMEESQKIYHLLGVLFGQALANIACFDTRKIRSHVRTSGDILNGLAKESDPCTIKSKIFKFHDDLLQYPENSVIADYTKNLFYRLGALRLLTLSDGQRVQSIQDELKAILRSLDTGNANAMRQSAHAHFDSEWSHIKVLMAPKGS